MSTTPAKLSRLRISAPAARSFALRLAAVVGVHAALLFGLMHIDPDPRQEAEPVMVSIIKSEPVPVLPIPPVPVTLPPPSPPMVREMRPPAPAVSKAPMPPTPALTTSPSAIALEAAPAELASSTPPPGVTPPSEAVYSPATSSAPVVALSKPHPPAVLPPRFDASYLNNPRPEYPRVSRRMGEHGKVMLRVYVTAQGTAERVEVRTSSGSQRLDQAARSAVEQWKFVPARQGDDPVAAWVIVPITFVLEG